MRECDAKAERRLTARTPALCESSNGVQWNCKGRSISQGQEEWVQEILGCMQKVYRDSMIQFVASILIEKYSIGMQLGVRSEKRVNEFISFYANEYNE